MLSVSLENKRIKLEGGKSACSIDWNGESVLVDDSASNALDIYMLFQNEDAPEQDKSIKIIEKMFVDPDAAYLACDYSMAEFGKLINFVNINVFGIVSDPDAPAPDGPEVFDLEQDAAIIRTSLRIAYGADWENIRGAISWGEFMALIYSLPYETPLGMRMYYRNPANRPNPNKHNKEQVKEFDKYASLFALNRKTSSHDTVEDANSAMTDVALSLAALV